jgi:hypothetical protein
MLEALTGCERGIDRGGSPSRRMGANSELHPEHRRRTSSHECLGHPTEEWFTRANTYTRPLAGKEGYEAHATNHARHRPRTEPTTTTWLVEQQLPLTAA